MALIENLTAPIFSPPIDDLFGIPWMGTGTADIPALVTTLGGDALVPALYDVRLGVTATTTLSQWDDARGSGGFGPSFTLIQGTAPAWDSINKVISGTGVGSIATALSAVLALTSVKALVFVGSTAAASAYACAIAESTSATRALGIRSSGATIDALTGNLAISSTVAAGSTRRVVIATINAGVGSIQVPNIAAQSNAPPVQGAGTTALTLGDYFNGGASMGTYSGRAILALAFVPSAGQVNTIRDWAIANHAAVAA